MPNKPITSNPKKVSSRGRNVPPDLAPDSAISGRNPRVWAVVCAIPRGQVATYKQVAALAHIEGPSGARQVGYALAALSDGADVPWHRVVNVKGTISPRGGRDWSTEQYDRLALEGIEFDALGRIDLQRFEWHYGD